MANQEDNQRKWSFQYKSLLINARLDMEPEFRAGKKKRTVLWERVLRKIKEVDETFPFSCDDIYRKFLNFMVTYKRIKKRNKTSGEAATTWDFYERLDEVYGCRSDISVPDCNLDSTINSVYEDLTLETNEPCLRNPTPNHDENSPPVRKRSRVDVVDFLKEESEADRKLLEEMLSCEKEKLKLEKEKIEEIKKLREALQQAHNWCNKIKKLLPFV